MAALPLRSREPADPGSGLDALDGLVGRWMGLRTSLATEQREWREQRAAWEREIDILEREAAWLAQELDENRRWLDDAEENQAAQRSHHQAMAAALARLGEVMDRTEADLDRWESMIPDGLRASGGENARPPSGVPDRDPEARIPRRGYAVVARYSRMENLHHGIHRTRELLETDNGRRRQVDVIFVGLAQAWAVSSNNDWAALGMPSGTGWTWRPAPEYAAAIRTAVNVLQRERTAQWIDLPLERGREDAP